MTQTSSKKKTYKKNIKLADGTVAPVIDTHSSAVRRGKLTKHIVPAKKFSTETGKGDQDWEVKDDYDSLPYPPPSTHPLFRKVWAESVEGIVRRDGFQDAHLGLLETYCRLRVELRALDDFLSNNGHTFRVVTALGEQRKTFPEVKERQVCITQIASYSKLLDLIPTKNKGKVAARKDDEEEWG